MMDFITEERAQAMQIGFILIFGIAILMLSMYQASIVPDQNRQAEITHSNDLEFEFSNFESNIVNTGMAGTPASKTYPLSMRYQTRFIAINPFPPDGSLYTPPTNTITISNESMEHNIPTRYLEHDINYRLYENPPIYTYETGFIYRDFDDTQTRVTENQFVLNNGFSIISLQGSYNETGYNSVRVRFEQADDLVKYEITNPEITVPTKLSENHWRNFEDRKQNVDITYDDSNEDDIRVTISRQGEMELYLTAVSIGDSTDGGVNHNQIDLPSDDVDSTPGGGGGGAQDEFEFKSYNAERTADGATYNFEVTAGDSEITEVIVQLRRSNNNNVRDEDIYDEGYPNGLSESGTLTSQGNYNYDSEVVFRAEDENGNTIERIIELPQ